MMRLPCGHDICCQCLVTLIGTPVQRDYQTRNRTYDTPIENRNSQSRAERIRRLQQTNQRRNIVQTTRQIQYQVSQTNVDQNNIYVENRRLLDTREEERLRKLRERRCLTKRRYHWTDRRINKQCMRILQNREAGWRI